MTGKSTETLAGRYWPIAALMLVYAVVVGTLVLRLDVVPGWGDPIEYMEGARNLGSYESAYHPPLYSTVIAGFNFITGDLFLAGKLVSLLAGLAVVILVWLMGRLCFGGNHVGLLAAALIVASPVMIRYSYSVSSDVLGTALFLGGVYALARSAGGSTRAVFLSGVLCGLAYMTRYVYLALLPAAVLYLLMVVPRPAKRKILWSFYFLVMFALVAAPWTIVCLVRHGDLHNQNYANIAFAILDTTGSWLRFETYAEQYPSLASLLLSHPVEVARHWLHNAVNFPLEILIKQGYLAGVFALLGALSIFRRPTLERTAIFFSGGALLALTLFTWFHARFFVPVVPVVMLFGAFFVLVRMSPSLAGYWPANASLARPFARVPLRGIAVALILIVTLGFAIERVPSDFRAVNIDDEMRAGNFLAETTPEGTPVLGTSPNLAWYADRPFVSMNLLQNVSPGNLDSAAISTGAKVIVYTKRHSTYTHPQLEFLLNPSDTLVPGSFRLLYQSDGEWPVVAYWIGE